MKHALGEPTKTQLVRLILPSIYLQQGKRQTYCPDANLRWPRHLQDSHARSTQLKWRPGHDPRKHQWMGSDFHVALLWSARNQSRNLNSKKYHVYDLQLPASVPFGSNALNRRFSCWCAWSPRCCLCRDQSECRHVSDSCPIFPRCFRSVLGRRYGDKPESTKRPL